MPRIRAVSHVLTLTIHMSYPLRPSPKLANLWRNYAPTSPWANIYPRRIIGGLANSTVLVRPPLAI